MVKIRLVRFKYILIVLFGIHLVSIGVILISTQYLPPVVPLFFGRPSGENQLAPVNALLLLPGLALGTMVVTILASQYIRDKFVDNIMVGIMVIVSLLSTFSLFKILSMVGSIPYLPFS